MTAKTRKSPRYRGFTSTITVLVLLFVPATAHADAGIPMLPFAYPVILALLLPVIAIEAAYIRLKLGTEWKNTISATAKANLVTMLLGFPLAWFIFLIFEMIFWLILVRSGVQAHIHWPLGSRVTDLLVVITSAAWMGPMEEKWAVPVAFVVLLIPSFVLSGWVESRLLEKRKWLKHEAPSTRTVWQANVLSYIFLALVGCLALFKYIAHF